MSAAVNVAAMPNSHDQVEKDIVMDLIDDAKITGPDPPLTVPTHQLLGPTSHPQHCRFPRHRHCVDQPLAPQKLINDDITKWLGLQVGSPAGGQ